MDIQQPKPMRPVFSGEAERISDLQRWRQYVLTFLVASLASTILLKIGEIQVLELIFLADFFVVLGLFLRDGMQAQVFRPYFSVASSYGTFALLAFLLSIVALRQNFYSYGETSPLKVPLLLTIARITELLLDVFYMLYLASLYRRNEKLLAFGMKTYFWFGIAGSVYAVVSFPLNLLYGLDLGTYYGDHRMRGFYNEGGPFGVYLVTLLLLTVLLRRRRWIKRSEFIFGMALFLVCLVMSQSKSALALLPLLGLINGFLVLKRRGRRLLVAGTVLLLLLAAVFIDFQRIFQTYEEAVTSYEQLSKFRSEDGNVVLGRVAGAVLAPRIIAEHPLAGVGWGNYALVRNDPQYRRGTPFSWIYDAPGLGPIDYIVDLGIPLWLYLMWIEFKPFRLLRQRKSEILILNLALMQPLSNIFGAHLNLTYPWVVVGFALGLGFQAERREMLAQEVCAA